MTTTTRTRPAAGSAQLRMTALVERLRVATGGRGDVSRTLDSVVAALTAPVPTVDLLSRSQRQGDPTRLTSRILQAEERFSVVALVLRAGQQTTIHDHLTWCVVAVVSGCEQEWLFRDRGDHLTPIAQSISPTGSISAFAPPGDIHLVRNAGATTAISMHIYGTDLRVTGSSVRRTYTVPVRRPDPVAGIRRPLPTAEPER
jgi:predicted metal-dependent enzyme (double-stranded beta helix superfamily)